MAPIVAHSGPVCLPARTGDDGTGCGLGPSSDVPNGAGVKTRRPAPARRPEPCPRATPVHRRPDRVPDLVPVWPRPRRAPRGRRVDGEGRDRGRAGRRPQRALQGRRARHRGRGAATTRPTSSSSFTPNATWTTVKAAAQGANVFVYLGHGNGWPSVYPPFQTVTKDGLGLDPSTGADGSKHVYYGEDYIRNNIRFAPNAVVLLYHLCYASGNTEPGLAAGHLRRRTGARRQLRGRVHRRGRAGGDRRGSSGPPGRVRDASAVHHQPDDGPDLPRAPDLARPPAGPVRVPAHARPQLRDGRRHDGRPSGFYRSIVGDLGTARTDVTGAPAAPHRQRSRRTSSSPGAAEVTDSDGVGLFGSRPRRATRRPPRPTRSPAATRLRVTDEAGPAADGTRVFAVTVLGASTKGFVRATGLVPRDSATVALDARPAAAGCSRRTTTACTTSSSSPRASPSRVAATLTVKNAAGRTVRSQALHGRHRALRLGPHRLIGRRGHGRRLHVVAPGQGRLGQRRGLRRRGSFTRRRHRAHVEGDPAPTAGLDGWLVSPVVGHADAPRTRLSGRPRRSAAASTAARRDLRRPRERSRPTADDVRVPGDRQGRRSARPGVTSRSRSTPGRPTIAVPLAGRPATRRRTWRGPVTVKPAFADATSGVAGEARERRSTASRPRRSTPTRSSSRRRRPHRRVHGHRRRRQPGDRRRRTFRIDTIAPVVDAPPCRRRRRPRR